MQHDLNTEQAPIESLVAYPGNPREGDIGAIAVSLQQNGQYRPIVVNRRDMTILAGNHTWKAAKYLGWETISVTYVDVNEEQARKIVLADNRHNDLASYDNDALAQLLQDVVAVGGVEGLLGTGFDGDDLDSLLEEIAGTEIREFLTDKDDAPSTPVQPVSKLGDMWLLGKHRVICGDATSDESLLEVMGDLQANVIWTDPPYGVSYVGGTKDALTIVNDDLSPDDLETLLRGSLGVAVAKTVQGGAVYVAAPSGPQFLAFAKVLTELGVWRQTLVWVKNSLVLSRSDYHGRHENIFYGVKESEQVIYGWKPGATHTWESDRKQDSILEFDRPTRSKEHPTMKPVELIEYCLSNSSKAGAVVLDPFGGSGSTLIAAHRTGRVARLVELDPKYVDVICRRYQEHTGELPVLASTGEPHDFVEGSETP